MKNIKKLLNHTQSRIIYYIFISLHHPSLLFKSFRYSVWIFFSYTLKLFIDLSVWIPCWEGNWDLGKIVNPLQFQQINWGYWSVWYDCWRREVDETGLLDDFLLSHLSPKSAFHFNLHHSSHRCTRSLHDFSQYFHYVNYMH